MIMRPVVPIALNRRFDLTVFSVNITIKHRVLTRCF